MTAPTPVGAARGEGDAGLLIEVEAAIVYRVGRRRFLTERAAWEAVARARIADRCICEEDFACGYHWDSRRADRLVTRYARLLRRAHRRERRAHRIS